MITRAKLFTSPAFLLRSLCRQVVYVSCVPQPLRPFVLPLSASLLNFVPSLLHMAALALRHINARLGWAAFLA